MEKTKIVKPVHGSCLIIAKTLDCSPQLVSLALNGKVSSEKADKIREMAIAMGGLPIYK